MEALTYSSTYDRTYSFGWAARGRNLLFVAIFLFNGWTWFARLYAHSWPNVWTQWAIGLIFIMMAGSYGRALFESAVLITDTSVSVRNIFGTRSLSKDEIIGRRKVSRRIVSDVLLVARDAKRSNLLVVGGFNFDAEWNEWVNRLPDLDRIDREQRLQKLTEDNWEEGDRAVTGHQRRLASRITAILTTFAAAACLAGLFSQYIESLPILQVLALILVLLPWVALTIAYSWPRLYSIINRPNDPRSQLAWLFLAPAMAFMIGNPTPGAVATPLRLLAMSILPTVVLTLLFFLAAPEPTRLQPRMSLIPILLLGYAWGTCFEVDTVFDRSQTAHYASIVLEPANEPDNILLGNLIELRPLDETRTIREIRVSKSFYDSVKAGDPVCVTAHHGSLLVPWISVDHCH